MLFNASPADMLKARGLFVTIQPGYNQHQWKLIYAGELSSEDKEVNGVSFAVYLSKSWITNLALCHRSPIFVTACQYPSHG